MTKKFPRRTLLQGLRLGAGAAIFTPLIARLESEARGEVIKRKVGVFVEMGQGFPDRPGPSSFIPKEFQVPDFGYKATEAGGTKSFTMPEPFSPLAPFRDNLLFVNGLRNTAGNSHGSNFTALSGNNDPLGPSLDQVFAAAHKQGMLVDAVLFGANIETYQRKLGNYVGAFVQKRNQPRPYLCKPSLLYQQVFGLSAGAEANDPMRASGQRFLLDQINDDAKRLMNQLGTADDRQKLESVLQSLEDYESARILRENSEALKTCAKPAVEDKRDQVADFDAMFEIASLAVTCGLTNTIGISLGQASHSGMGSEWNSIIKVAPDPHPEGQGYHGHGDNSVYPVQVSRINQYLNRHLAVLATKLKAIKQADGSSLFDNSLFYISSDRPSPRTAHHGELRRWPPVVLMGGAPGLKLDGRYVAYEKEAETYTNLLASVGEAFSLDMKDTVAGAKDPFTHPLSQVLR